MDAEYYRINASVDGIDEGGLVEHYLQVGWRDGFDPSPTFRAARYLNATPGLRESGENPFAHYLFQVVGETALTEAFAGLSRADTKQLRLSFDARWYLYEYPNVEMRGDDPFIHYMVFGWRNLHNPSRRFSTRSYLERYPDIRDCGANPFLHWVLYGIAEGRSGDEFAISPLSSWESLSANQQTILANMFGIEYYWPHANTSGLSSADLLADYINSGRVGGGNATPSFRTSKYVAANPDLYNSDQLPLLHFLFVMVGEGALHELFVTFPLRDVQAICEHFDTAWYLYSYPDVEVAGMDAFIHYMVIGWRERRDPSSQFSTRAYLLRYPDIAESGMNPLLHWVVFGRAEGRIAASSSSNFRNRPYAPSITAILINSEVDPLSTDCLTAVLQQSYGYLTIVVVGEPLADACREIVETFKAGGDTTAVGYLPDDGQCSRWMLLERAVEHAAADLIWFVRGQVVHNADFLARLTSSFADGSVQLGFGRRLEHGDDVVGTKDLLRKVNGWERHSTIPAATWFSDNLRLDALAGNQQSFLWRRRKLADDVWRRASDYHYLDFWHLYLHMASGGQIASVRDALMWGPPVPELPVLHADAVLYDDVRRLAAAIRSFWDVPCSVLESLTRMLANADVQMGSTGVATTSAFYNEAYLSKTDSVKGHILLVTHGIFAGGAENFPIQLANELFKRGLIVSLLIFKTDDINAEMRSTLNPGVSIYEADWVLEYGCEKFLRDIGCSLIHSHGVVGETFFFQRCACTLPVPYVATLHGSYEASTSQELPESLIAEIVSHVDLFIYTADKNLAPLLRHHVRPEQLVKLANAMPIDQVDFPQTREELGIAEDAVVFTLVARGIKEKGWATAIDSFKAVQRRNPNRTMHLCLVGEGDEPERLEPLYAEDASISFLGFQLRIHGLYRMTDVAIVPTRFAGESYPLCVIQALQAAVPVIATDIGEIASMLQSSIAIGGLVVANSVLDEQFEMRFADAMDQLMEDERREQLSLGAGVLGGSYDMSQLTGQYVALYEKVCGQFAAAQLIRSM